MSLTDIPRAYIATIRSSKASKRRWWRLTICGSKLPARSRGASIRTEPCWLWSVFGLVPLRWLPTPPGGAWPRS
jgi:hypothetical protein